MTSIPRDLFRERPNGSEVRREPFGKDVGVLEFGER